MALAAEFLEVGHVCHWEAYEPSLKADLSSCAILTEVGLVLIDPIPLALDAFVRLRERAPAFAIVLTNGNHWRAAANWRDELGVPVLAHADAAAEFGPEGSIDRPLTDGASVGSELRVISLPGAGPGEIALVSSRGSVHVGDALIHMEPIGFGMLPDKYCQSSELLHNSLLKLLRFDFELLTFAHGHPLTSRAKQRLTQLLT